MSKHISLSEAIRDGNYNYIYILNRINTTSNFKTVHITNDIFHIAINNFLNYEKPKIEILEIDEQLLKEKLDQINYKEEYENEYDEEEEKYEVIEKELNKLLIANLCIKKFNELDLIKDEHYELISTFNFSVIYNIIKLFEYNKIELHEDILFLIIKNANKSNKDDGYFLKKIIDILKYKINKLNKENQNIFCYLTDYYWNFHNNDGMEKVIDKLIDEGANINLSIGHNLIYNIINRIIRLKSNIANINRGLDCIKILLKNGADINALIKNKRILEVDLSIYDNRDIFNLLIENNINIEKNDIYHLLKNNKYDIVIKILQQSKISFTDNEIINIKKEMDKEGNLSEENKLNIKILKNFLFKHKSVVGFTSPKIADPKTYIENNSHINESMKKEYKDSIKKILAPQYAFLKKFDIDSKQKIALRKYTQISGYCTSLKKNIPNIEKGITIEDVTYTRKIINKIFETIEPLTEQIVVYRGIKNEEAFRHLFDLYKSEYCGEGYVSTSYDADVSLNGSFTIGDCCLLTITLPSGSRVIPLDDRDISIYDEYEILLPIDSEFYQTNEYYYNKKDNTNMKVYDLTYRPPTSSIFSITPLSAPTTPEKSYKLKPTIPLSERKRINKKEKKFSSFQRALNLSSMDTPYSPPLTSQSPKLSALKYLKNSSTHITPNISPLITPRESPEISSDDVTFTIPPF